eukprot:1910809-Rhodomonas_salina.1
MSDEDFIQGPWNTTDRFIDMLESVSEKDAGDECAVQETAKALLVAAKAKLVKEGAGAVNAFVNAQEKGIALPP